MRRRAYLAAREKAGNRVTIGFAGIADFRSIIGQEYIAGITKAAADHGVNLLNFAGAIKYSLSGDIDFLQHYLKKYRYMRPNVIDGLVTWASSLNVYLSDAAIGALHAKLQPLPLVDLGVSVLSDVPGVTIRSSDGIRLVMDHLVDGHGYTRFGFVGCTEGRQYQERLDAWRAELARRGWEEDPSKVGLLDSLEPKDIRKWVDTLCRRFDLRGRRLIDALVTVSDVSAATLLDELEHRGIRVPQDVAVTGFNNQIQSIGSRCPLTTVDLGYFRRGYAAVELLLDRIENPEQTFDTRIMESSLVIRQSCGCFERGVTEAGVPIPEVPGGAAELRAALAHEPPDLVEAVLAEVSAGGGGVGGGLLSWFQRATQQGGPTPDRLAGFQDLVTRLRALVLSRIPPGADQDRLESVFHQARILVSQTADYYQRSHKTDAYRFNDLARIAISFASAIDVPQVFEAVRHHLGELEMPGIFLVLQEELAPDIGSANLELVHPPSAYPGDLPVRIHESAFIPRSILPRDRPWVMMFEILYASGMCLGYALIERGPDNVALYDAVRTLLSHALYAVYVREGRNSRLRERLLRSDPVRGILAGHGDHRAGGLDARQIVEYLMDRLADPTDLDAIARDLALSKSYLIRRTKALTGYTVQALHELLKIERAKALLETRNRKVADIAAQLGYQNPNYFSAVFRKNTGASPQEWLRRRG